MSTDCLFCKIVRGDIPCAKVYEDENFLAFLDIGPIIKGHTLVIPREHYASLPETPAPLLADMMSVVQRIAGAQMNALKADGINIVQNNGRAAGQLVDHIHFHIIPRFTTDGHKWNWAAKSYDSPAEMQSMADQISARCS
ncbi:MAG TPA: HIT family protein [Kiritimatiellia bacterium]|nr:HIT family protein [Kiritimatiellia bacterium]HNS80468.1 HIT family protein [Kiritimatiellia bacterium]HPA77293.1 HIT family protein [Kiritimatiellia bacterium]HQQ03219.1 HIT family protein [Kiritimatiellia bacterium]